MKKGLKKIFNVCIALFMVLSTIPDNVIHTFAQEQAIAGDTIVEFDKFHFNLVDDSGNMDFGGSTNPIASDEGTDNLFYEANLVNTEAKPYVLDCSYTYKEKFNMDSGKKYLFKAVIVQNGEFDLLCRINAKKSDDTLVSLGEYTITNTEQEILVPFDATVVGANDMNLNIELIGTSYGTMRAGLKGMSICYNQGNHEHNLIVQDTIAPTCSTQGKDIAICSICNYQGEINFVDTLPHEYENGECVNCKAVMKVTQENYASLGLSESHIGYYAVSTAEQLVWFAKHVNEVDNKANVVLLNDIDYSAYNIDYPIGCHYAFKESKGKLKNDAISYCGTFDGAGHSVTIGGHITVHFCGSLFNDIANATIKNLRVNGTMTADCAYGSCFVGYARNSTIEKCIVDVNATYTGSSSYCYAAFLTDAYAVNVLNCAYVGSYKGGSNNQFSVIANMFKGNSKVVNCYENADITGNLAYTIAEDYTDSSATNYYYTNNFTNINDGSTKIDASAVENGELCYKLNGNSSENVIWKQTIYSDAEPLLFGDSAVVKYDATNDIYTNSIDLSCVHPNKVRIKQDAGNCQTKGFNIYSCSDCKTNIKEETEFGEHVYSNGKCTICNKLQNLEIVTNENHAELGLSEDYIGYYIVSDVNSLKAFSSYVNTVDATINGVMTSDIDMNGVNDYAPIGFVSNIVYNGTITQKGYKGTFDGRGHVVRNLTARYFEGHASSGVFGTVSGTVKNLGVDHYTYNNSSYDGRFGCITGQVLEGGLVENCFAINSTVSDSKHIAGSIAGCNYGGTIRNCYDYNVSVSAHSRCGHLVGDNRNDDSTYIGDIVDCYSTGNLQGSNTGYVTGGESNVASSRYISGEIAYKMNKKYPDIWYQQLQSDQTPVLIRTENNVIYASTNCLGEVSSSFTNSQADVQQNLHNYVMTSLEDGTHAQKCSLCDDIVADSIENCTFEDYISNDQTHSRTCSICNYEETNDHTYGEVIFDQENCSDTSTCTICNHEKHEVHHTFVYSKKYFPGCVSQGYDLYTCEYCDAQEQRNVVDVKGHKFERISEIAPTCLEEGSAIFKCSTCSKKKVDTIPALGHSYGSEPSRIEEPTCIETGYKHYACTRCNEEKPVSDGLHQLSQDELTYYQSKHNYADRLGSNSGYFGYESSYVDGESVWTYEAPAGTEYIDITFSENCEFEKPYDYICIYNQNQEKVFDGQRDTNINNKTIRIEGSSFIITLYSDGSVNKYGFELSSVVYKNVTDEDKADIIPALGHNFVDGKCTRCQRKEFIYVVEEDIDGELVQTNFDDFVKAWKYCSGKTATITLYDDVTSIDQVLQHKQNTNLTINFGEYDIDLGFKHIELSEGNYVFNGTTGTISSNDDYVIVSNSNLIINGGRYRSNSNRGYVIENQMILKIQDGYFYGENSIIKNHGIFHIQDGEFIGKKGTIYSFIQEEFKNYISGGKFISNEGSGTFYINNEGTLDSILADGFVGYEMDNNEEKTDNILIDHTHDTDNVPNKVIVAAHENHTYDTFGKCSICNKYDESQIQEDTVAVVTVADTYKGFTTLNDAFAYANGKTATIQLLGSEISISENIVIDDANSNITLIGDEITLNKFEDNYITFTAGQLSMEGYIEFDCIDLQNGQALVHLPKDLYTITDFVTYEDLVDETITKAEDNYQVKKHTNHTYNSEGFCEICNAQASIKLTQNDTIEYFNKITDAFNYANKIDHETMPEPIVIDVLHDEDNSFNSGNYSNANDLTINIGSNILKNKLSFTNTNANIQINATTGGVRDKDSDALKFEECSNVEINGGFYKADSNYGIDAYLSTVKINDGEFYGFVALNVSESEIYLNGGTFKNCSMMMMQGTTIEDEDGVNIDESVFVKTGYVAQDQNGNIVYSPTSKNVEQVSEDFTIVAHEDHQFDGFKCNICNAKDPSVEENAVATVQVGEEKTSYTTIEEAFAYANGKTATIYLGAECSLTTDVVIDDENSNITLIGDYNIILSETNKTITINAGKLLIDTPILFNCITLANGDTLKNIVKKPFVLFDSSGNVIEDDTITSTDGNQYMVYSCRIHNFVENEENHQVHCTYCGAAAVAKVDDYSNVLYFDSFKEALNISQNMDVSILTLLADVTVNDYVPINQSTILNLGEYTLSALMVVVMSQDCVINATTGGIKSTLANCIQIYDNGNLIINGGNYRGSNYATIYCDNQDATVKINSGKFYNDGNAPVFSLGENCSIDKVYDMLDPGYVFADQDGNVFENGNGIILSENQTYVQVIAHKQHTYENGICTLCKAHSAEISKFSITIGEDVFYADTLKDALFYASKKEATIKLLDDVNDESSIPFLEKSQAILDLDGHTLSTIEPIMAANSSLVIKGNGKYKNTSEESGFVLNNVDLTIENGIYEMDRSLIKIHNTNNNSILIKDGKFSSKSNDTYLFDIDKTSNLNLTVENGEFTSKYVLFNILTASSSQVRINNGTFTGSYYVMGCLDYVEGMIEINGGKFESNEYVFNFNNTTTKISQFVINNGEFNGNGFINSQNSDITINDCMAQSVNMGIMAINSSLHLNDGEIETTDAPVILLSGSKANQSTITGGHYFGRYVLSVSSSGDNRLTITGGRFEGINQSILYNDTLNKIIPVGYVLKEDNGTIHARSEQGTIEQAVEPVEHKNHEFVDGACQYCDYPGDTTIDVCIDQEYTYYSSLEDAIAFIKESSATQATITIHADQEVADALAINCPNCDITIMNNNIISTQNGIQIQNGNVIFDGQGEVNASTDIAAIQVSTGATLLLDGGTFTGISLDHGQLKDIIRDGNVLVDSNESIVVDKTTTESSNASIMSVRSHSMHLFDDNGVCIVCNKHATASVSTMIDDANEVTYYDTFIDAINYAQGKTATITLYRDDTIRDKIQSIPDGTNITIELGEHMLSMDQVESLDFIGGEYMIHATTGGINVDGVNINFDHTTVNIDGGNYNVILKISDNTTLNVDNATLNNSDSLVYIAGQNVSTSFTDSTLNSKDTAIICNGINSTVNVNRCTIDAWQAFDIREPNHSIIKNSTITTQRGIYIQAISIVELENNTINTEYNVIEAGRGSEDSAITINGGTYTSKKEFAIDKITNSSLIIYDGTFKGLYALSSRTGNVALMGGTYISTDDLCSIYSESNIVSDFLGNGYYYVLEDGTRLDVSDTNEINKTVSVVACNHEDKYVISNNDGTHTHLCANCNFEETQNCIFEIVKTVPCCLEEGYKTYQCSECKGEYDSDFEPISGHSYTNYVNNNDATCTENGTETAKCDRCDATNTRTIENSALGHDYGEWYTHEDGTHSKDCSRCDDIFTEDCQYESVITDPTCLDQGYTTHTCSKCNHSYSDAYVDALGHEYGNWYANEDGTHSKDCIRGDDKITEDCQYESVISDPTCTEQGYTTHTCTICGHTYKDAYVDALGHDYGNWHTNADGTHRKDCGRCDDFVVQDCNYESEVSNPTCLDQGYTTYTCSDCGHTYKDDYVEALGHSFTNYVNNNDVTCLEDGSETAKCDRCDVTDTRTIENSALGHEYGDWYANEDGTHSKDCIRGDNTITEECNYESEVSDPTCLDQGYTTHTCSECGHSYKDTYVDALGHSFKHYVYDNNATCLEDGSETAKCERCDVTDTRTVSDSALGHSFKNYVDDHNATCTDDGSETAKCDRCDVTNTRTIPGSALGHDYGNWYTNNDGTHSKDCSRCDDTVSEDCHYDREITKPTCLDRGYTTYTCDTCDHSYESDYVDALGHSYTNYVDNHDATCTTDGSETAKCDRCDATDTRIIENSTLGHSFKNYVDDHNATCTTDGSETAKCDRCEATNTRTIENSALGHEYGEWHTNNDGTHSKDCIRCDDVVTEDCQYESEVSAPTCLDQGYTTHTCSDCGHSYKDTYVDALDHSFTNYIANHDATCTSDESETAKCDRCDVTDTRTIENSALGHEYGEWYTNNDGSHSKDCIRHDNSVTQSCDYVSVTTEATCTTEGYTTYTCTLCGYSYVGNHVDALGHEYGEWHTNSDGTHSKDCVRCDDVVSEACDYVDVVVDPTCTQQGYTTHTCTKCEYSYSNQQVNALGHAYGNWYTNNDGTHSKDCTRCDDKITEKCAYESVVTAPTCLEKGYTTYTCTTCDHSYVDDEVKALGHSFTNYVDDENATCTQNGTKTADCDRCDATDTKEIPNSALGHEYGAWYANEDGTHSKDCIYEDHTISEKCKYDYVVTKPTCIDAGYTTYTCTVCDHSYVDDEVKALGHTYGEWYTNNDGTHSKDCENCDHTVIEDCEYTSVVTHPTYDKQGYTTYTCDACKHSYVSDYQDVLIKKPSTVTGLKGTALNYHQVKLTWNAQEEDIKYYVYRSTQRSGDYTRLTSTDLTTLTVKSLKTGQPYFFKVRAYREKDGKVVYGDYSSIISATTSLHVAPVLVSVDKKTYGTLQIKWKGVSGATSYILERKKAGESEWKQLKTFGKDVRSAESRSLETGSKYYYRVRASRYSGADRVYSPYSSVKSNTPTMNTTKVTVEKRSSTSARISWKTVSGANGYEIYRATSANGSYIKLKTLSSSNKSLVSKSLKKGTIYYYKVRAYRNINGKKIYNSYSKAVSYTA